MIPTRSGMTLIELLAATVLAALVMIATLGVIRSLATARKALDEAAVCQPWKRRLAEQLRADLLQSRLLKWDAQQLRLRGYAGRHPVTGVATQRPTEIVYAVRECGTRAFLVRVETALDAPSLGNHRSELAAEGISHIRIQRREDDEGTSPDARVRRNRPFQRSLDWSKVDWPLTIVLTDSHDHVVLSEQFQNE